MRITMNSGIRDAQAQLERAQQEIAKRTQELSSGRRLNALSDDPPSSFAAVLGHGELGKLDSYARATDSVESRLTIIDSVLNDIIVQITAAMTLAAASRGSEVKPQQLEVNATQLEYVRDTILSDVLTQFNGTYLFSGNATTTEPYTKTGNVVSAYLGTTTDVLIDVDESTAVRVTHNGDTLLKGTDTNDIFVELGLLITAVRAADAAGIDTALAALKRAFDRANAVQSGVGNDLQGIANQRLRLQTRRIEGLKDVSRNEDANLVETITALQNADTTYQAALRAIGFRTPLSLMDFLR